MLLIIQLFLLKYPERQEECSVKDKNNYQRASLFLFIYLIMILDLANENRHLIKKIQVYVCNLQVDDIFTLVQVVDVDCGENMSRS